jgi:hypothetical protein
MKNPIHQAGIKTLRNSNQSNFFISGDINGTIGILDHNINKLNELKPHGEKEAVTDIALLSKKASLRRMRNL